MVYVFLAEGFEEIEAIAPVDMLRRAGADVKTVGVRSKAVLSNKRVSINSDITEDEAVFDNLEMLVIPGGLPGVTNLEKSEIVKEFVKYAFENNLYIGAICAGPSLLGKMGILKGVKSVVYPGFEDKLEGAIIQDDFVCIDRNFITAKGAGVSVEFGLALVNVLYGADKSEQIKKAIQSR